MYYLIVTQGESSDDANNFQIGTQYEDKATLQHHAKLWHINDSRECIAVRSSPTVLSFKCINKNSGICFWYL